MNFYLIGIDYKRVPLNLRESVYKRRTIISQVLNKHLPGRTGILSTCNRFEIYGVTYDESQVLKDIDFIRLLVPELAGAYARFGFHDIFRHLTRLATGLESQLKGELQILQQLQAWLQQRELPDALKEILQEALSLAKEVRLQACLFSKDHNIAKAVFYDLRKQAPFLSELKIIIAGTGKIAELFARHKPQDAQLYFVAHKNINRAKELAKIAKAGVVEFNKLPGLLETTNVLISASASPHFIFLKKDFINLKLHRPLHLYDVAMPADIDPAVKEVEGVILKNLQGLTEVFEEFNTRLAGRLKLAEYLIEEALKEKGEYGQSFKNRHAAELTCP